MSGEYCESTRIHVNKKIIAFNFDTSYIITYTLWYVNAI